MNNHTTSLKKIFISTVIIGVLASPAVYARDNELTEPSIAEQQKTNKNIGFGTGMVVGALVAGPIGAIVSSALGVITADHFNIVEDKQRLTAQLTDEQNNYQAALARYQQKLQIAEQAYQEELASLQQQQRLTGQLQAENLLMSLQFSTGSSELKSHYQPQISALAKLLNQSPKLKVDLSGYTDLQGSDELNHALSIARVNSVKQALIEHGVAEDRINLFAFGEQEPVVANNQQQASFYDRRVVIKLQASDDEHSSQQTVSNF